MVTPQDSQIDYSLLAKALLSQVATKDAGTTPTIYYGHGPAGLFSQPGINPDLVASFALPNLGVEAYLPVFVGRYESEIFQILTGITAATGSQPTTPCADCIQPGNLKVCNFTLPFGQECMDSQVIEVTRAGQLINRSEMLDYRLVNNPFADLPKPVPVSVADALKNESSKKLLEMFATWPMQYGRRIYTGNPANTAGNTGGNLEYNGLDILINTGYRDAFTGVACPSADSLVVDAASLDVISNGATTVTHITEMLRYLKKVAEDIRFAVTYRLAMRYGLWIALTEIWPCNYLTNRCISQIGDANFYAGVQGAEQNKMREEMRKGMFLWVDGQQIPVIIDDAIAEVQNAGGVFESDIYFLPFGQVGDRPTLYIEHFDMGNDVLRTAINDFAPGQYQVTPDGRFIINFKPASNWCIQIGMRTRKRVVLRTPFLAARLTNLDYTFADNLHERTWFGDTSGSDSSFYTDGGQYRWNTQQSYFTPLTAR